MKLKEINRTAIQSWSPAQHHPIYLATGTSAQQLDASFSTNASLEFFELDLTEPSLDMKSCGSLSSSHRYHKLVWGPFGMDSQGHPSGVLVAGGENGNVILYDPAKIMAGETNVIIAESDKHTGPVRALDVNPFQTNLVASGGNESEIYIWDMNNFGSPMTPGPKTQPLEDISCVSWNRQVQHILASASPSGRASVWDLRKNDLIIKVSDHSNRMHCSGLAWNPEVATQLVISSEDDRMPVIQMWDLRFATSPLKILENHTRGILAIAWSLADPELLLSCGKDNRILCWNPNTAEVLYELPTSSQWCFDIQWCPRNPAVLSAASFDGHIDIYSIMGGTNQAQSQRHADQISNSFGNLDPFGTGQTLPPLQLPQTPAPPATVNPLKKPPKWIRRPVGASFAFGGKLLSLENTKLNPQQPQQPTAPVVHISQVVTETAFLKRSDQLQATLSAGSFVDFCQEKIDGAENEFEKTLWSFLKANFETDIRSKYLELLGYNKEELALKISAALEEKPAEPPQVEVPAPVTLQPLPDLSFVPPVADTPEAAFDMIAAAASVPPADTPEAAFDMISAAATLPPVDNPEAAFDMISAAATLPPVDNPEAAFDMISAAAPVLPADTPEAAFDMIASANLQPAATLELNSAPDPETEEAAAEDPDAEDAPTSQPEENVDEVVPEEEAEEEEIPLDDEETAAPMEEEPSPPEILAPVEEPIEVPVPVLVEELIEDLAPAPAPAPTPASADGVNLSISQDVDGLITQALLTGDFEGAVELCLHDNRMADSIILAIAGGPELLEKTQKKYFTKTHSKITKLISAVVMKDWHDILKTCDLQNWREALAAVVTYAQPEEFSSLCDLLGGRLEAADDAQLQAQACLSYICAGNVEKLVSCWTRAQDGHCPLSLQDLVEKVVVLRRAVEQTQRSGPTAIGVLLAEKMSQYANLLASQGSLSTAITYLPDNTNQVAVQQLRDRLSRALGQQATPAPAAPVQTQRVQPAPTPAQPAATLPRHPFTPMQPAMVPQQPTAAAPPVPMPTPAASAPAQPQYYQPVRATSTVTSWSNQTPTALPNVPPPPLQVGNASEQQVEPSNPMYGMPPPCSAAPASSAPYISHQYQRPQNGWNDPPALNRMSKKKPVPMNYTPPAPITAPIMAPLGGDPQAQPMPAGAPQAMVQGPHGAQVPYSGMHQHQQQQLSSPPPPLNPAMPKTSMEGAPGAPTGDVIQPLQSIPAEKIMKKPIPDEHLVLKTTFEGLIQKCLAVATDPQTKRKLDDANKRLEALYDKLREQTLSPAIVGGLHNIARSIESRSYTEGLNIHTHIVSNSNFSETSAFMPVLKVVLTQANKLGV
uniref:protein transport protein Sec31A isoform X4 n=1 Tax=Epinephelus lanceolatus TaxID=310571 RepID=UPI0014469AD5|nr:protein transport protein Sec31A isoform X4 [Epinephelus lanceolatus]